MIRMENNPLQIQNNYLLLGNNLAPSLRDYFKARVADDEQIDFLPASIGKFVSTEAFSEIKLGDKDLKGRSVAIVQSLAAFGNDSVNDFCMQLLLTIRTLKRNGAGPVWVIAPFAAYSRQDRPFDGRMTSVAAEEFAIMLKEAGADGFTTIDMHSEAGLQYFIDQFGANNTFNLDPTPIFAKDIKAHTSTDNVCIGGPDAGANLRAANLANALGTSTFAFKKQHKGVNDTEVISFEGNVEGKTSITVDDMIDTGGTIVNSQKRLAGEGAKQRRVYSALPLFSNDGLERLFRARVEDTDEFAITELVVTDTTDIGSKVADLKRQYGDEDVDRFLRQISVGDLLYSHIQNDIFTPPKP